MNKIKNYFKQWNSGRVLRLVIGIAFTVMYLLNNDVFYLGLSVFFLVQAVLGIGCCACSTGSCEQSITKPTKRPYEIKDLDLKQNKKKENE